MHEEDSIKHPAPGANKRQPGRWGKRFMTTDNMYERDKNYQAGPEVNKRPDLRQPGGQQTATLKKRAVLRNRWTKESYLCEKGPKITPSSYRSMESPGKYSRYPQRPREECGPSLDMIRAIR
jgi:hypothetical protein